MWSILGISPTIDIKEIKKAYSKQLKRYHPEVDPIGYQRLREAFDEAIKYAKRKAKEQEKKKIKCTIDLKIVHDDELYGSKREKKSKEEEETLNINIEIEPDDDWNDESDDIPSFDINQDYENETYYNLDAKRRYNTTYQRDYTNHNHDEPRQNKEKPLTVDEIVSIKMDEIRKLYEDFFKRNNLNNWKKILESKELKQDLSIMDRLGNQVLEFIFHYNTFNKEILDYLKTHFEWEALYNSTDDDHIKELLGKVFEKIANTTYYDYDVTWNIEGFDYDRYLDYRLRSYEALVINDFEQAYNYMKLAWMQYDNDPVLIRYFCVYYKLQKRYDKGLEMANKLIDFEDYSFEALEYICFFSLGKGNYRDVINRADTLLSIDKRPEFYYFKAKALYRLGQYRSSIIVLHYGLKRFEDDAQLDILFKLAEAGLNNEEVYYDDIKKDIRKERVSNKGNQIEWPEYKDHYEEEEESFKEKNRRKKKKRKIMGLVSIVGLLIFMVIFDHYFPATNDVSETKPIASEQETNTQEQEINTEVKVESNTDNLSIFEEYKVSEDLYRFMKEDLHFLDTQVNTDLNEVTGTDMGDNRYLVYFIYRIRVNNIDYILQLSEDEHRLYKDQFSGLVYAKKFAILNKEEIVDSINNDTNHRLVIDNTIMFDGL